MRNSFESQNGNRSRRICMFLQRYFENTSCRTYRERVASQQSVCKRGPFNKFKVISRDIALSNRKNRLFVLISGYSFLTSCAGEFPALHIVLVQLSEEQMVLNVYHGLSRILRRGESKSEVRRMCLGIGGGRPKGKFRFTL